MAFRSVCTWRTWVKSEKPVKLKQSVQNPYEGKKKRSTVFKLKGDLKQDR